MPAEMVMDLVTAGRALGHPNEHYDPHSKWHRHRHKKDKERHSSDDENHQPSQKTSQPTSRNSNESVGGEVDQVDEGNDVNGETYSSSTDEQESDFQDQSLSRARTLQLEKTVTMSGGSFAPKRHNRISEAASQGSRMSKKFINLVIWLPTDLTLSLSKGFHNAPKLYHDPMVKSTPKVIGVRSGFKAAGQVRRPGQIEMIRDITNRRKGILRRILRWSHGSRHSASICL